MTYKLFYDSIRQRLNKFRSEQYNNDYNFERILIALERYVKKKIEKTKIQKEK